MTNPYHNPYSGEFCSQGAMRTLMTTALSDGDFEKYSTFRGIIDDAEKDKNARIMEGFKAVKANDSAKIKDLVGNKLSELADSSEERAILSGWSKNATPETLDLFLKNPNFAHTAFEAAYEHLSEEDKLKFLKENQNLTSSKLAFMLNGLVNSTNGYNTEVNRERAKTLLEREMLSSDMIATAKRSLSASGVVNKLSADYNSGDRNNWPFHRSSVKQELSLLNETSRQNGDSIRMFFAKQSNNREVLATIGGTDPIALDNVLDNPNISAEVLSTIIRTNNSMSSVQYDRAVKMLTSMPDLPPRITESLKKANISAKPVYNKEEEKKLMKKISSSRHMMSFHGRKLSLMNFSTSNETHKEIYKKGLKENKDSFEVNRAQLDATEQNYDSLIKQKNYLEKNIVLDRPQNRTSYKVVVERLAKADSYRKQKGGSDNLKKSLANFGYNITPLRNGYRY